MSSVTYPTTTAAPPRRSDGNLFLGDLPQLNKQGLDFWLSSGRVAPLVKLRFGHIPMYLVTDADYALYILQSNGRNYVKERRLMDIIETGGDKVLFTTDGDEWLWRRRLMQPAFHRKQIANFGTAIVDETEKMLAAWQHGAKIEVEEAMKLVTMMIIGRTMFSVDMEEESSDLHDAYRSFARIIITKLSHLVQRPLWLPTPLNREFLASREVIQEALGNIIAERRHATEPKGDLLDMLLAARLEEGDRSFTEEQLMLEMSSIVFAGHETTAETMTWLLYLLSQHPDVEEKVLAELDRVLGGRTPTVEDLGQLTYLNQVINETLRLYPAAYVTSRQTVEADRLGEHELSADAGVIINIIGIQRDPRYWEKPNEFWPDHFSAENSKFRHKAAFFPFALGARKCIGEPLSRVEMQLILATILQRYRLRLPVGTHVEPEAGFVLHPKNGVWMTLERRTV